MDDNSTPYPSATPFKFQPFLIFYFFFLFVTFSRHLLLHLASFWEACFACFLTEVFFSGSRVLFTRPPSTIFSKKNFKIRSHGTIHTFKIYFITVFSIFSNKRYPNRFLFNFSLFISSIKWRSIQPSFSFAKPNWSNAIRSTTMPLLTSGSWVFFFFFPFSLFFFQMKKLQKKPFWTEIHFSFEMAEMTGTFRNGPVFTARWSRGFFCTEVSFGMENTGWYKMVLTSLILCLLDTPSIDQAVLGEILDWVSIDQVSRVLNFNQAS